MKKYKLMEINNGKTKVWLFDTLEDLKQFLNYNDFFSWIKDNEDEEHTPDFLECETIEEIKAIFKKYDYSWWEMRVEYDKFY